MSEADVRYTIAKGEPAGPTLETVRVSDVQAEPVRWLWPNRFALGKVSLIAGDPGLGKSMLALTIGAHVTTKRNWPADGTACVRGSVLLVSGEDDVADTIRPRLEAAGADITKVEVVGLVRKGNRRCGFSLEADTDQLIAKAGNMEECRLIVIDPISAYLGGTDSHNNADVRGLLAKLQGAAARIGAAVLMVTHLNKGGERSNALYRATGSLAFVAAARAAFVVCKDRDDPRRRLFLPLKNNLAEDRTGIAYRIVRGVNGAPCLSFEAEPVTITAEAALSGQSAGPKPREEAKEWLRERLARGPVYSKAIMEEAAAEGLAEKTIRRAKDQLGIVALKSKGDMSGGWLWQLPKVEFNEDYQLNLEDGQLPNMGQSDHLRENDHLRRWPEREHGHRKAPNDGAHASQQIVEEFEL